MKKSGFYFVLILIASVIFGLYYFGIIQEVQIKEQEVGPFKVVYKTHIGDYSEVGKIQNEIVSSLLDNRINTTKWFGIYYDNPQEIEKSGLRSEVGVIIDEKDYSEIMMLKGKYNIKNIPKSKNVVATFPYRNKYSIMLGVFKVYPKLNKYIEEKNYLPSPIMEIYDSTNQKIIYLFEIVE
ncbi:MAG: GyrI-like domain-containing protein [Nanoarchaeota archaeon]